MTLGSQRTDLGRRDNFKVSGEQDALFAGYCRTTKRDMNGWNLGSGGGRDEGSVSKGHFLKINSIELTNGTKTYSMKLIGFWSESWIVTLVGKAKRGQFEGAKKSFIWALYV